MKAPDRFADGGILALGIFLLALALLLSACLAPSAPVSTDASQPVGDLLCPAGAIPDLAEVRWCCTDAAGRHWLFGTPGPEPAPDNLLFMCPVPKGTLTLRSKTP